MEKYLFSVIVPVYNIEKYLRKCVDSILSNTYKNIEVVLVDDGSPDGCPQICDMYSERDKRVRVIHKENGGLVSARQAGVRFATGDYVFCVDGDDWVADNYFEANYEIISEYGPDIVCSGYISARDNHQIIHRLQYSLGYYDKERIIKEIYPILIENENGRYFSPQIWAKAFKTALYKQQQQVDSLVSVGEDHACTKPCIFHAESMFLMEGCFYYYRINPDSMTRKPKPYVWGGPKEIGKHFEKQLDMKLFDFQDQVYRNVVHNVFNVAVSRFNQKKSYGEIAKEIRENLKDEYYVNAIEHCRYHKNLKGSLARTSLKYRLIFLMYLYNIYNAHKKGK